MNFKDQSKVRTIIQAMVDADDRRARNRSNINSLFNGDPPFTDAEARADHIETNVNFLEAAKIAHDARRQFSNAYLKPGNFFTVTLDSGPDHKRSEWGKIITRNINRVMKGSLPYIESLRSTHAQVVLHGVGPNWWPDQDAWCPTAMGIGEVLVPSKTKVSLENLDHFAIRVDYSYGKLFRMTQGAVVDRGWSQPLVKQVLASLKDQNSNANDAFANLQWEDIQESFKANSGYYESDAVPTVKCWAFYFRDEESEEEVWKKRIILDTSPGNSAVSESIPSEMQEQWLFNPGDRNYASQLSEILHVQFGDGANVAPFRWHSVRSLGLMLYSVCHLQNRLRSKLMDATFESLLQYFRNVGAEDRERLEHINLAHLGILPEGVEWVPGPERYHVDARLVESAMAQNRQSMSENSSSFVQDVDNGTRQAQTATETMAKVNSSAALISGMLTLSYTYEGYKYSEIARRFCRKGSPNNGVKKFREACLKEGVPEEQLNHERWMIEPERVMGAGNKTVEIAQADRLMQARSMYDPGPQREILHIFTEVNTDDPQLAERLVPMTKPMASDAVHDAQLASGTLMMGLPMELKQGVSHIEYVETLLAAMSAVVQKIEANGGTADETEIAGLQNLAGETVDGQPISGNGIADHIAILAQDKNEQQRVKQYSDVLGKLMNQVKAYAQRWQEQQQAKSQQGGGLPPEAIAKIESSKILAQSAAQIKEAKAQQQMAHKDASFNADQQRKNAKTTAELHDQVARQQVENVSEDLKVQAEILRKNSEAAQTKPKAV